MKLTADQWFAKLKTFVPPWFFEEEENNVAHFRGLSKVLEAVQSDAQDHLDETFLLSSSGDFLDSHGNERSTERTTDEFDAQYSFRVQNLTNRSNLPDIKRIVDRLLIAGEASILEDKDAPVFAGRDYYVDREEILIEQILNTFSIIVDKQLHEPYSFADREYFEGREHFVGQAESSEYVFDLIVAEVNKSKASGTFYRVLERLE